MKLFIKIFLSLCVFLFNGKTSLYAHSYDANKEYLLAKLFSKSELSAISFVSNNHEVNPKFDQRKLIENSDKNCLLEIEEEQDEEKSGKKQITLITRSLTIYPHKHLALSCTEKGYINSTEYYCFFSAQRYITFRTIRV